jgi:hypothetical protein
MKRELLFPFLPLLLAAGGAAFDVPKRSRRLAM